MDDKLAIKLKIIDRYFPLKIDRKEEEKLREAAKRINDVVVKYSTRYPDKDNQDFLSMALLQFVTKLVEIENMNNLEPVLAQIEGISKNIGEFLEENS